MKRVLGIGNALVDIMIRIPDEAFLESYSLPKGSMQLVGREASEKIMRAATGMERSVSPGGSVANTMHSLGLLECGAGYIGSVGEDEMGALFTNELKMAGVSTHLLQRGIPTGTAVALVTPDSERTFATHLGAAIELIAEELTPEMFAGFDILYLEGYLIANFPLAIKACEIAKSTGMLVALDLSSFNIVEEHKTAFTMIVNDYVDILFANEEESKAFTGLEVAEAADYLATICDIAVVKTGEKGSLVKRGSDMIKVDAVKAASVDTTGAGDMYAAGFLYGLIHDKPLEQCGRYGAVIAGEIVKVMGAKMEVERWNDIRENLL